MAPRISVPSPCSASWADMTPAPGGRHCAACNKVVVDFRALSVEEIARQLQATTSSLCAAVHPSLFTSPLSFAHSMPANSLQSPLHIQGVVLDADTKSGIGGATVEIQNTPYGVYTAADGSFSFQLSASWLSIRTLTLLVSQIYAYKSRRISVRLPASRPVRVRLPPLPDDTLLGLIELQDKLLPPPLN